MEHIGRKIRCDMNKTKMVIAAAIAVLLANADAASKVTYRDSLGRQQGSATTDSRGKTTYRDAQGRIIGTLTTDRYGKTTYRDAQGRIQGSKK